MGNERRRKKKKRLNWPAVLALVILLGGGGLAAVWQLKPELLAVTVGGKNIMEFCDMSPRSRVPPMRTRRRRRAAMPRPRISTR